MSTEAQPTEKKSYKDTLNLPQTAFAMEAKLVQNEPARLRKWQEERLYERLMEQHFGNHPLSMSVLGSADSVGRLERVPSGRRCPVLVGVLRRAREPLVG